MANTNPLLANSRTPSTGAMNPLAKAMADAEREKQFSGGAQPTGMPENNLFSQALSKSGGSFDDMMTNPTDMEAQQRALEEQRKKEALRRKLHDQINPVNTTDIFNAREQQVKREIEQVRQELEGLVKDVEKFHKQVEVTLMTETVSPGQEGTGYKNFFHQLRIFILLLRSKIKSAQTWATQMNAKSKKKKQKGMQIGGMTHEKTSTIQDMMHHERSSQYSGG